MTEETELINAIMLAPVSNIKLLQTILKYKDPIRHKHTGRRAVKIKLITLRNKHIIYFEKYNPDYSDLLNIRLLR